MDLQTQARVADVVRLSLASLGLAVGTKALVNPGKKSESWSFL